MDANQQMFEEAVNALHAHETQRARDLFSRLLKLTPGDARVWIYMSAVVETPREREFCLKEALRLDPENRMAKRGLTLMGLLPPDPAMVVPLSRQMQNRPSVIPPDMRVNRLYILPRWAQAGLALLAVALLAGMGVWAYTYIPGLRAAPRATPTLLPFSTLLPSLTPRPVSTPTVSGPVPLWMKLAATYTPTPVYVNTPHPRSEAFRSAQRAAGRGEWDLAVDYLQQVLTIEPDAPDLYYHMGEILRQQGKWAQAYEAYDQSLQRNLNFAPALLGRARARLALDAASTADALSDLNAALLADPAMQEVYLELGLLQARLGDAEAAQKTFDAAGSLNPQNAILYIYRANAALALQMPESALGNAKRAVELDITLLEGYRLQGQALYQTGNLEAALEPLQTYVTYAPDDLEAQVWLAQAYTAGGQPELALQSLNLVMLDSPASFDLLMQRGLIYLDLDDGEAALEDLLAAAAITPRDFRLKVALGRAYLLTGKKADAYQQLSYAGELAAVDAEKAEVYYWRAQALEALSETRAALRDWQLLLDLGEEAALQEWREMAQERLQAAVTPSATPRTPTPSQTRVPTRTLPPTATRQPTRTPIPSRTPTFTPSAVQTSSPSPTPTFTPSPTPTPRS